MSQIVYQWHPDRVSFDPAPLLPDGYTVVFQDFEAAMMGAGPEFENGYWLIAAPTDTTPARALTRLSQAFTDAGVTHQPARDDWQAELADEDAWLHLRRYVPDTTEVDNVAPEQQLLAAAHDHPGRPLIYLFATGNWSTPGP